jgi:hypothetical protein
LLPRLLPFPTAASVYSVAQLQVNAICCCLLNAWQNVAVEVERDRDARVAESLLRNFRMDPGREQLRGVGVAQIVQAHALQLAPFEENFERVGEAARLRRLSVGAHDNVMIISESHAEPQQTFRLLDPMLAQLLNNQRRKRSRAAAAKPGAARARTPWSNRFLPGKGSVMRGKNPPVGGGANWCGSQLKSMAVRICRDTSVC